MPLPAVPEREHPSAIAAAKGVLVGNETMAPDRRAGASAVALGKQRHIVPAPYLLKVALGEIDEFAPVVEEPDIEGPIRHGPDGSLVYRRRICRPRLSITGFLELLCCASRVKGKPTGQPVSHAVRCHGICKPVPVRNDSVGAKVEDAVERGPSSSDEAGRSQSVHARAFDWAVCEPPRIGCSSVRQIELVPAGKRTFLPDVGIVHLRFACSALSYFGDENANACLDVEDILVPLDRGRTNGAGIASEIDDADAVEALAQHLAQPAEAPAGEKVAVGDEG